MLHLFGLDFVLSGLIYGGDGEGAGKEQDGG